MPLIKDYLHITEENIKKYGEKTILLMQVGAFFEVYGLKNSKTSKIEEFSRITELKIASKKMCVSKRGVLMAGFHLHFIDKYVKKLNDEGYTVVVYTQDFPGPKSPRNLQGIYSPGTNFNISQQSLTNNIMCIKLQLNQQTLLHKEPHIICGISSINIITGKSVMFEYNKNFLHFPTTYDEIERFACIYQPHELIIIYSGLERNKIDEIIQFAQIHTKMVHYISLDDKDDIHYKKAKNCEQSAYQLSSLNEFFKPADIDFFYQNLHFHEYPFATQSFCFLLDFIHSHQPDLIRKISEPEIENIHHSLLLANHSLKQLNIIDTGQHGGKISSVLSFLNDCKTPMGRRKFKQLLLKPTIDIEYLQKQYAITQYVKNNFEKFEFLRTEFVSFRDIEKLYRKIILNKVCPAELVQFYENMKSICFIEVQLKEDKTITTFIKTHIRKNITKICKSMMKEIKEKINMKKAEYVNKLDFDTNIFKRDIFVELDNIEKKNKDLFDQMYCIQKWLGSLIESFDKKKKGPLVKIHETEKSGYNLDITKRRASILKTRLTNETKKIFYISSYDKTEKSIDFSTKELKFTTRSGNNMRIDSPQLTGIYNNIIIFKHKLRGELEKNYKIFIDSLSMWQKDMETMVTYISLLDVLSTKAYIAKKYNYCCPKLEEADKSFFIAKDMRHCLIEHLNKNEIYVPNDISLGSNHDIHSDGILLFGTNAVGKSSLIRSIGICIVLAQAGMFVPCSEFIYKPYTTLYTRILGNDDIFKGLSTFAVEMSELRTILTSADDNSLILGDELCSGTETNSAISIFVSGLTMLSKRKSSFIFATHFHQVTTMKRIKRLKNLNMKHMEVKYDTARDLLIYNRKLKSGAGNSMYGLEVCKSLNLPLDFLDLAYEIRIEEKDVDKRKSKYNTNKIKGICEICQNNGIDIHHLEYQEDANEDGFIEHFHKNHPGNLISICKECHDDIHRNNIRYRKTKTSEGMMIFKS